MQPHERRPSDLANALRYLCHPPEGDGHRFHFYLYYRDETRTFPTDESFHAAWIITGTDWDPADERGESGALEAEHRAGHQERFIASIEQELHRTDTILVKRRGQLIRVNARVNEVNAS